MDVVQNVQRMDALSVILIVTLAFTVWTMGLYLHRWLSKLAGHGIPPVAPARHIP